MLEVSVHLPVHLAVIELDGVEVREDDSAFVELERCAQGYRQRYVNRGITSAGGVEGTALARELFRLLGIDPTRHRPSSEALLNRALKGKPLPRINTLVDVGNWCSLDFLLPLGVYDRERISGPVTLRRGAEAETYQAIGDRTLHLEGRYVLADARGAFGSPIADALRAAVHLDTALAAVILYGPPSTGVDALRAPAQTLAERVVTHCGGGTTSLRLVSAANDAHFGS
ncbi:MAG: B3/B4 domain-containing protein [Planctomycetota bacterium]|jgi:DNA/RNA-binding domain of Phe-tRNA-synthetase-like protein